jgi:hypothetical protein
MKEYGKREELHSSFLCIENGKCEKLHSSFSHFPPFIYAKNFETPTANKNQNLCFTGEITRSRKKNAQFPFFHRSLSFQV